MSGASGTGDANGAATGFDRLVAVMARLRDPESGCPWDLAQSLDSLKPYLVEESYEALDAIDALGAAARATAADVATTAMADPELVAAHRAELGDVLLQVAFQSRLAEEFGWFTADDVAHGIADKMERRHPHVFAAQPTTTTTEPTTTEADGAQSAAITIDEVRENWQAIKAKEALKARKTSVLDGVPRQMPALLRGQRIGSKAAHIGFDWPDVGGALAKVDEELIELREAIASADTKAIEHELGDVLFALTSVARHAGVDAEQALRTTLDRFQRRFSYVEQQLAERRSAALETPNLETPNLETLERWWQVAKARTAEAERS